MDDCEEARLVFEARRGSRESFERLLNRYERPIFNAAYRILNDYEDARDVTQNVFLKAFENLGHFNSKYRFFSWIYRIAVNESINQYKKRSRPEPAEEKKPTERNTPETLLRATELSRDVQVALMSIGFEYRVVIVLRHFNDCSYRDISKILEIPEKTVKSRLFTGRSLLKEVLSKRGIL